MTLIKDFIESLEVRSSELQALNTELNTKSQNVLKQAFVDFFKVCPDIVALGWTQYTPYFNDGDECTFRINSFTFSKNKELILNVENITHYNLDDEDGFNVSSYRHHPEECTEEEYQACLAIEGLANQLEDICKSVFGDHSSIVVTPTDMIINEYSHD